MSAGHTRCSSMRIGGFSLIELMIAMVVGLILIGGVFQVYLNTKNTYRTQEALGRVQETGRFALDMLNRGIRQADFWGCMQSNDPGSIVSSLDPTKTTEDHDFTGGGIEGVDGGDTDPDTLILRGASGVGVGIFGKMNSTSATLKVTAPSGLQEGQIVLLSDCESGDIFQITNINDQNSSGGSCSSEDKATGNCKEQVVHNSGQGSPGNSASCGTGNKHCLSKEYDENAQVFLPYKTTYNVAASTGGLPNLMRDGQPLLEGVENLQILYGVDSGDNGAANQYVAAGVGVDWNNVVSIRYAVLVRSIEPALPAADSKTHDLLGTSITTNDRFLRAVFSDTVTIRNRAH
jgi:type IV pilus assembly protein PilW